MAADAGRAHASLLLIHGDERHLVDRAAHDWRQQVKSKELDVEVFDAPARLDDLRRSASEVPLLDPERSILVRDPPQLNGNARRGADPPEALASLLAERAASTSICLVAHARVSPQNPVLVMVKKLGGKIAYHQSPRGREIRTWVDKAAQERGLRLGAGSVEHILLVVGTDLGAIASELDKLVALADGKPLPLSAVQSAVAGDEPIEMWGFLEQLLGPHPGKAAATVDHLLAEGRSSQHLLAILAGQARDLLLAQSALQMRGGAAGLAAELRIPEWRAERLARQAQAVTPAVVAGWLRSLHDIDRGLKAGEVSDSEGLRLLALRAAAQIKELREPRPTELIGSRA
jgi:DNA polymerase III subunit delta